MGRLAVGGLLWGNSASRHRRRCVCRRGRSICIAHRPCKIFIRPNSALDIEDARMLGCLRDSGISLHRNCSFGCSLLRLVASYRLEIPVFTLQCTCSRMTRRLVIHILLKIRLCEKSVLKHGSVCGRDLP